MNTNSGTAAPGNLKPTAAQNLDNEEVDISQNGKRERPSNVSGSEEIIIPSKRKPDENDGQDDGELRKGEARELDNPPKGLGRPWGLSDVGNSGNALPANEALGEPWPLSWRMSPPSAYSGHIGPENPLHSKQRSVQRRERLKLDNLQKDLSDNTDEDEDFNENKNPVKVDQHSEKEKEKGQPKEKEKDADKIEFMSNKFELEYDFENWIVQLARIGAQLYSDVDEDSEDEDGNKFTSPAQKTFKVIIEKNWFEKTGQELFNINWERFKIVTTGKNMSFMPPRGFEENSSSLLSASLSTFHHRLLLLLPLLLFFLCLRR
jgi:hypothetical protein